jgi:O-antigen/teichoic acid export membrane protein
MASVVLGPQWTDVAVLMPWFALTWGMWGVSGTASAALDTIGKPRISTYLQWFNLAALGLSIFLVAHFQRDILAIAIVRLVVTVAFMPIMFFALSRALEIPLKDFVMTIWRPALAGLAMAIAVLALNSELPFIGPVRLILDILLGASAFIGVAMALWFYVGRPEGPEADAYRCVRQFFRQSASPAQPAVAATAPSSEDQ